VRLQQQFDHDDFNIITINVGESKEQIVEFMKKVKLELPIMLDADGQAVKDWGVYAYPSSLVLDRKGVIRYAYLGALEWDSQSIINTIRELL
jgi:peroxiredoxin